MIKYDVQVEMINPNTLKMSFGLNEGGEADFFFRDEVDRFSDPYVPMDTGFLKNTKSYPDAHSIKYVAPYASYMWYGVTSTGKDIHYRGSPKRGKKWAERMMIDRKQSIIKDLDRFLKRKKK